MTESGDLSRTIEEMYKEMILDHWRDPQNKGLLEDFDAEEHVVNQLCGDAILLRIKFKEGRVEKISFDGEGCAISQAAASLLTEFVKGKTKLKACKVTEQNVLELLQIAVIPSRLKCALLPFGALQGALSQVG